MIITITGKPCSGKGVASDLFEKKYNFKVLHAGEIFRSVAVERGIDILELNRLRDTSIDKMVDDKIIEIGKTEKNSNLVIDSRTAWHFIPDSFKVFIDVDSVEQVRRMKNSGRTNEIIDLSDEDALKSCNERFDLENERYKSIYGFDNTNLSAYDFVINNTNLTIEETTDAIYNAYQKFINSKKSWFHDFLFYSF